MVACGECFIMFCFIWLAAKGEGLITYAMYPTVYLPQLLAVYSGFFAAGALLSLFCRFFCRRCALCTILRQSDKKSDKSDKEATICE